MRARIARSTVIVAALFVHPGMASAQASRLSDADRAEVERELHASSALFLDAIAHVSPAQWTFKPGPTRWSIAEVAEHVVKAEGFIGGVVLESLKSTPMDTATSARHQAANASLDAAALAAIRDRSKKAEAPAPIVPTGTYKTPQDAAAAFVVARARTIAYVDTTHDDLRDHFSSQITGSALDGVQGLLTLSGHTERHVAQIEEVKHSSGYPPR